MTLALIIGIILVGLGFGLFLREFSKDWNDPHFRRKD